MFFEEWELITEPLLLQPLPLVYLSGMALKDDDMVEHRAQVLEKLEKETFQLFTDELVDDLVGGVSTPPLPPPDLHDPAVFKDLFEERNKHLGLYFTQYTMDASWNLFHDVKKRLASQKRPISGGAQGQTNIEDQEQEPEWDLKLETVD